MTKRCEWAGDDPLMVAYHDEEWGVPLHTDRGLFEFLILEGAQAGLSWSTILRKRHHSRKAFDNFAAKKIKRYTDARVRRLLNNPGIVRNRLKVAAAITNAAAFLEVQDGFGSFDTYVWGFTGGKPIQSRWRRIGEVPTKTDVSDAMSRDLKKPGLKVVGSTICYAFMQAVGMVNDHTASCFRWSAVARPR